MFLARFLYRNMKGYRFLAVLAILVAITQVSCDIIALQSLKWIPSKAQNPGNDPCTGYVRRVTHDEIADAVG
jgi:hypothetical protein